MSAPKVLTVTSAQFAALKSAGGLVPGYAYLVNNVPYFAQTTKFAVAGDGQQAVSKSGYSGLVVGASGEERCYGVIAITSSTIAITAGVVTFRTNSPYPVRAGHRCRLGANNYPETECIFTVTSAVPESGGTRVIGTIDPSYVPPDVVVGHASGNGPSMQDLQCMSTTASWASMLQILSGARLKLQILGSGGTIIQDWLVDQRVQQVRAFGRMDFLIIGAGIAGNALNANGQAGDVAFAAMCQLIELHDQQFNRIYLADVSALTNEFSGGAGAGGANTAVYAAGQRYLNALDEVTTRYPKVQRIPVNAYETVIGGQSNSTDGDNAYCQVTDKQDDGVHDVFSGAWHEAEAYWGVMKRDFPQRASGAPVKPFSVIRSVTPDPGAKYVRNLAEGLFGTVANTGSIPNHSTGAVSNLNGMTLSNRLVPSRHGGSDWLAIIKSNGNQALAGTAASQIYTGTANSLLTQLNLARNQGVPIRITWDGGVYGFNELTMGFVELCVEVDTGDGQGLIQIAAGLTENGLFSAAGSTYATAPFTGLKGGQAFGFWGMVPFPEFIVPVGTVYTAAQVRQSAKPKNGFDPGIFILRQGPRCLIEPAN